MIYYLNKFRVVVKDDTDYVFSELESDKFSYHFNSEQEKVFKELLDGKGIDEVEIAKTFGDNVFKQWKENAIILLQCINPQNQYSRNASYFWHMNLPTAIPTLSKKNVLILGCGGIGSHIAWNLATIGVGNLYIVDFDHVEASNLNRQLLYDHDDIGKLKTEVLAAKLKKINPNINIIPLNQQISSETELNHIVEKCKPDCIVKALDSPIYFSSWLDEVCEKKQIKYVTGILSGTKQMIGPTYLPGISSKYTDFFKVSSKKNRIHGIGPSLSFVMYQLSGELAEEVIKILLNQDNLLYLNKVYIKQNLTGETEVLRKYKEPKDKSNENILVTHLLNIIIALILYYCCKSFNVSFKANLILAACYVLLMPLFETNNARQACKLGFICLFSMFFCNIINLLSSNVMALLMQVPTLGLLSMFFMIFSITTLLVSLYFIFVIWLKNLMIRKVRN